MAISFRKIIFTLSKWNTWTKLGWFLFSIDIVDLSGRARVCEFNPDFFLYSSQLQDDVRLQCDLPCSCGTDAKVHIRVFLWFVWCLISSGGVGCWIWVLSILSSMGIFSFYFKSFAVISPYDNFDLKNKERSFCRSYFSLQTLSILAANFLNYYDKPVFLY